MQSQNAMFVLATMNFISNFTLLGIPFCLCCKNLESFVMVCGTIVSVIDTRSTTCIVASGEVALGRKNKTLRFHKFNSYHN